MDSLPCSSLLKADGAAGTTEARLLLALPWLPLRVRERRRLDGLAHLRRVARGALGALLASARSVGPGAHLDLVVSFRLGWIVLGRGFLHRLLNYRAGLALAAYFLRQRAGSVGVAGFLFLRRFVAVRFDGLLNRGNLALLGWTKKHSFRHGYLFVLLAPAGRLVAFVVFSSSSRSCAAKASLNRRTPPPSFSSCSCAMKASRNIPTVWRRDSCFVSRAPSRSPWAFSVSMT